MLEFNVSRLLSAVSDTEDAGPVFSSLATKYINHVVTCCCSLPLRNVDFNAFELADMDDFREQYERTEIDVDRAKTFLKNVIACSPRAFVKDGDVIVI